MVINHSSTNVVLFAILTSILLPSVSQGPLHQYAFADHPICDIFTLKITFDSIKVNENHDFATAEWTFIIKVETIDHRMVERKLLKELNLIVNDGATIRFRDVSTTFTIPKDGRLFIEAFGEDKDSPPLDPNDLTGSVNKRYDYNFGIGSHNDLSDQRGRDPETRGDFNLRYRIEGIVDNSGGVDSDGDSLYDKWEQCGIDTNKDLVTDFDLAAHGANPNHKDIFVEVDYMANHRPRNDAINDVVTAFANAPVNNPDGNRGINLHVEIDEEKDHQDSVTMWEGFNDIKSLGTRDERASPNARDILLAKRDVYHYAIFIHQYTNWPRSAGLAESPGNDFIVSFGASGWGRDPTTGHNVGTRLEQAGTFMHELGHNLGLLHGGNEREPYNCKPNYFSIMSYTKQAFGGILTGFDARGNPIVRLDYSRQVLNPLDESALSENAGIEPNTADWTIWGAVDPGTGTIGSWFSPGNLVVDWDVDGIIDDAPTRPNPLTVNVDINNLNITGCGRRVPLGGGSTDPQPSPGQTLRGYDDWNNLDYNFRDARTFSEGEHGPVPPIPELTAEDALKLRNESREPPTRPPTDFTVKCQPVLITILPGTRDGQSQCTVESLNGFAGTVDLRCESPTNPHITCSLSPSQVTPPPNGSIGSTLTASATLDSPIGIHDLKITAASGGRTFTITIHADVQPV